MKKKGPRVDILSLTSGSDLGRSQDVYLHLWRLFLLSLYFVFVPWRFDVLYVVSRRSNNSSGSEETVPLNGLSAVVNRSRDMDEDEEYEDDDQEVTVNGQPISTTVYECSGLASTEVSTTTY